MHFLGQDLCADLLSCKANDSGLYRIAVSRRQVRDRDLQSAVCVDGSRLAQVRYLVLIFESDLLGLDMAVYQSRLLVILEHLEYIVGRGLDHLRAVGQDDRLQYIDKLCDIRHLHAVRMLVEDVEVDTCYECVTHRILLIQKSRICARLYRKPGAPLIDNQAYLLLRIILIHDRTVTVDQCLHIQCLRKSLVPCLLVEVGRTALDLPSLRMCIIMKRKSIHESMELRLAVTEAGLHHTLGPLIVIYIRSACDLENLLIMIVLTHIGLVSAVKIAIVLRCHISAAAPVLIADSEIINGPCVLMTIFLSHIRHRRYALKGHILYPLRHLLYRAASDIAVDVCLTAQLTAQLEKFMCTKAVVLYDSAPVRIDHFLTGLLRTYAVSPVILVCEASARPAKYRNLHLLECLYYIVPHTVRIRDVRILSYVKSLIDAASKML